MVEHEIALRTNWNKVKEIILNKRKKLTNQAEGNEINLMKEQGHWLKFRQKIQMVVDHKFFQCFIFLIIAVNAVVLASESSEISETYQSFLELSNFICTIIFSVEIAVYLIAYGERYFFDWWNIFDFLIIVQCIISIILKNKAEYTIIRTLRMLKLVKLQKFVSLIALQRVVAVVLDSIENIARLIIVMFFLIFLFAVIGNRVLGHYYHDHNPAELPRWSFATFGGSLFTVFRIFSGEWIEPLWNCMRLSNTSILCPFIIISYYLIGHLIILGLFVALLLSSFNMSEFEFSASKQKELMKNMFQKCYKFFSICCEKKACLECATIVLE
ncbi:sodium channel protein PaFPC1-like [Stegodyphus dumicola]|uniref:sodium channel protein PaFPC1-like n=1 Tax=Stegodyphus dumicola TaxID=202533 RepID=UPI0015A8EC74|nr:sodium channel protein PaFPC1-like [Stegodyphus dumicola]